MILGLLFVGLPSAALAAGAGLAGTAWQLLAIYSMDDAQGTTKVPEPSHFTLEFGRDGLAALRLDCNRGTGGYKVEPAADGSMGSLTFGPVAATRVLCPSWHLDERDDLVVTFGGKERFEIPPKLVYGG